MTSNNITKIDFSKNMSDKTGFPISLSKKIVDDMLIIFTEMIKNNDLVLKNIGTFKLSKKNERIGRNPKTKEKFLISERKSIRFIVSKNLSKVLNL
ncbi:MAG: HU family DNA-binding protein [Pseudomonadota bacterium]|nr:HU family DNA-binding protein [Pseudomonadota bacterium]|tara:strand:- start:297 stop:584 length:288 start_codon:yes stop_codon:yes gene_type:complete